MPSYSAVISKCCKSDVKTMKFEQSGLGVYDDEESKDDLLLKITCPDTRAIVTYHFNPVDKFARGMAILAIANVGRSMLESFHLKESDRADLTQLLNNIADSIVSSVSIVELKNN